MTLPPSLSQAMQVTLRASGDPGPLSAVTPLGGGDINHAARITTPRAGYFIKWHPSPPPAFFECESRGLRLLADAGCVRVPQVVGAGRVPGEQTAFLILEYVEPGSRTQSAAETLGRALARQHRLPQSEYGLDHDNYIGRLPQPNRPSASWIDFYRSQRLGEQRGLASRLGHLPLHRARLLDSLMDHLDRWIDESACRPCLLHGDLWGGNWMAAASGEPVLIDPAVCLGDRELDLAMTALFGGFPPVFYDAYQEVYPLPPGYHERQPLYQLYFLLVHLNLFGEGYGSSVDGILRSYGR